MSPLARAINFQCHHLMGTPRFALENDHSKYTILQDWSKAENKAEILKKRG
jgi:hypothetical protein